jgi:hypothetical protein
VTATPAPSLAKKTKAENASAVTAHEMAEAVFLALR